MLGISERTLIDATPLQSEHNRRGVGAYVRHLIREIESLRQAQPHYLVTWQDRHKVADLIPGERAFYLPRPHRPAQIYWIYNEAFLRAALLALRPRTFLATDFNGTLRNPFGKTVAVLHDLTVLKSLSPEPQAVKSGKRLSNWRWRVYARKLHHVDHIVAISESVKRDACDLIGIPPDRLTVIHHGVDQTRFKPMRGRGAFARNAPYLLSLGAREENKNQTRILEAYARIAPEYPRLKLYFAGPWEEVDLAWLQDAAARHGLAHRVRHVGFVPEGELPSLFANASGFVFPSIEEGFGLPILEAMASGTPVITSNRSAPREVAGDAALLVDPLSTEDIASAMGRLLASDDISRELVRRGLSRAHHFNWQRTAHEMLQLLATGR